MNKEQIMNPPTEGQYDLVNHPAHYEGKKYECINEMIKYIGLSQTIDFCKCNAFKYLWRWDNKNGIEDIEKAQWYVNKAIELLNINFTNTNIEHEINDICVETQGAEYVFRTYVTMAFEAILHDSLKCLPIVKKYLDRALVIYYDFLV